MNKEIEIIIGKDGKVSLDQKGWNGKDCHGDIDEIIKALGKEVKTNKKAEFYKTKKVQINQQT